MAEVTTKDGFAVAVAMVPVAAVAELTARVSTMNRRAKRLGCAPLIIHVGAVEVAEKIQTTIGDYGQSSRKVKVQCQKVTIIGEAPKMPGAWRLVARVQLLDGTTLIHSVPGETVPVEYRQVGNRCDHCGHNRVRNDVFVLRNTAPEGAKHIVVGRTCIQDFLGGVTPQALAWSAEALDLIDMRYYENYYSGIGGGYREFAMAEFTAASACAIREFGWTSRGQVRGTGGLSTSDYAMDIYSGRPITIDGHKRSFSTTDEDITVAEKALSWAAQIDPETDSDYLLNIHRISELTYAPMNCAGLAASIVSSYQREQGRLATQKLAQAQSRHVGTVGKRQSFGPCTVQKIVTIDGHYGTSFLHIFRDASGNVFNWFATNERLEEGRTYQLTGSVKKHDTRNGIAQTNLTRCKAA